MCHFITTTIPYYTLCVNNKLNLKQNLFDMRLLKAIIEIIGTIFLYDPNKNLFGAKRRREAKEDLANEYKAKAEGVDEEIAQAKALNPFESASSKSAMAKASKSAQQMQQKTLNTLGAGASAEALVAAQGTTAAAQGAAAGQIATGAEALKESKINNLKSQKMTYEGQESALKQSAIGEYGQNYKDIMASGGILSSLTGGIL